MLNKEYDTIQYDKGIMWFTPAPVTTHYWTISTYPAAAQTKAKASNC